jgi:type II secretory pathway component PulJ
MRVQSPPRPGRRRGVSLIETVVVVSLAMASLSLVAGSIHMIMKAQFQAEEIVRQGRNLSRLDEQFRRDIHRAESAELIPADDEQPARLLLILPEGRTVRYEPAAWQLFRLTEKEGEAESRERYSFPEGSLIRPEREEDWLRLVIDTRDLHPDQRAGTWRRPLVIEARLSRDHRFHSGQ